MACHIIFSDYALVQSFQVQMTLSKCQNIPSFHLYCDDLADAPLDKMASPGRGRFERGFNGARRRVGCYIRRVGYCSLYVGCYSLHLDCYTFYVG